MMEKVAVRGECGKALFLRTCCQGFLVPGLVLAAWATDGFHDGPGRAVEVEKGAEKLEEPRESHGIEFRPLSLKLGS